VAKVLCIYPRQALWSMILPRKGNAGKGDRARKAKECMDKAKQMCRCARYGADEGERPRIENQTDLQTDFGHLTDKLLQLSNLDVAKGVKQFKISSRLAAVLRIQDVGVVVPKQRFFSVNLPPDGKTTKVHDAFASNAPTITKFCDEVEVLASLQKPKKICLLGSDGKEHALMLKPKDDLRKDGRLMELFSMLNRFLKIDPECRRRNLRIPCYAVVPITEDSGLIEWVDNLTTLRTVLGDIYTRMFKMKNPNEMLRPMMKIDQQLTSQPDLKAKMKFYMENLGNRFPPMLHDWYIRQFPEPNAWFAARVNYAHSLAVMSMVGYVVGLGDRHSENVLLDSKSGAIHHVDFNMLFGQGKNLAQPERVPFRLTPNMVDGLGVQGIEGVYRNSCEITMRMMRKKKGSLMNVLDTFVHDPLLEWTKRTEANEMMGEIEAKLSGLDGVQHRTSAKPAHVQTPLSVEGQVTDLIGQATSVKNLCQMYVWWMAWW